MTEFTTRSWRFRLPLILFWWFSIVAPTVSLAADAQRIPVGYEFATWLGTGLYRIGDRDVWILNMPLKYELVEATQQRMGARVLLPVSIGWLDTRAVDTNDLQTTAFIPGLELTFKPTQWWTVRTFAQTGVGNDFNNDSRAWIYAGGIKSRMDMTRGETTFSLGNALVGAGSRSEGKQSGFGRFDIGLGVEQPMSWKFMGHGTKVSAFSIASFFSSNADFITRINDDGADLGTVYNLGLALGVQEPFRFLGLKMEWLGLSWLTGDNIKGLRLNAGFPF